MLKEDEIMVKIGSVGMFTTLSIPLVMENGENEWFCEWKC